MISFIEQTIKGTRLGALNSLDRSSLRRSRCKNPTIRRIVMVRMCGDV
jgi:hypothetical protein